VATCLGLLGAAFFAHQQGKQAGFERGYDFAMNQQFSEAQSLTVDYLVDDVLKKAYPNEASYSAIEKLVKSVKEHAKPETWDFVGGRGVIDVRQDAYDEHVLRVSTDITAHLEVSDYLDDLRGAAFGIIDRSFVQNLDKPKVIQL